MLSLLWGLWDWWFRKEERKLIIVGVDNAGKSTTLEQLRKRITGKGMDLDKIPPTIGLNIGRFEIDGVIAICWDVGGQLGLRQLWMNYFEEVEGVVFITDSSDRSRFDESSEALKSALSNSSLKSKPLLFLANKHDIPEAVSLDEIRAIFHLDEIKDRPVHVLACSARKDEGLDEGIRWIVKEAVKYHKLIEQSVIGNMTIEIFLRKKEEDQPAPPAVSSEVILPDNLLELEMMLKEVEFSLSKLQESTDIMLEEFRKSDGEEAREYYEYITDNFEVIKTKTAKIKVISDKMNAIRGIHTPRVLEAETSSSFGGMVDEGHLI